MYSWSDSKSRCGKAENNLKQHLTFETHIEGPYIYDMEEEEEEAE